MAFQPKFARPKSCPVTFSSQERFIAWLVEHGVPYEEWGDKDRSKAWKEIEENDAVYYYDDFLGKPVRFICVVAARVTMMHPEKGHLVLAEYVRDDKDPDWYKPRRQKDSSLSEKILLNRVSGTVVERPLDTIVRCFEQELSLNISASELKARGAVKFLPWHHSSGIIGDSEFKVEIDPGLTEKRPGVRDYRQVAHYTVELSPKHYRDWYRDPQTRYFARWHSVNQQGNSLEHREWLVDRIPSEEIHKLNWAAA